MAHRLQKVHGVRIVKYTPVQNHMRKIKKALPKKYKRDEVVDIVTALLGTTVAVLRSAGVSDANLLPAVFETTKGILGVQGASGLQNVRQENTPVVDFSKAPEDEDLPVLPVQGLSQEEGQPVQDEK